MSEQQKHKNYRITIAPSAIKTLGTLENALRTRIQKRIEELADMPRHRQSKKLEGEDNLYRNRVGVYRIVLHDPRRQIDRPSSGHRPSTRDLRPRLSGGRPGGVQRDRTRLVVHDRPIVYQKTRHC